MKRIISFMLVILMMFSMVVPAGATEADASETPTEAITTETGEEELPSENNEDGENTTDTEVPTTVTPEEPETNAPTEPTEKPEEDLEQTAVKEQEDLVTPDPVTTPEATATPEAVPTAVPEETPAVGAESPKNTEIPQVDFDQERVNSFINDYLTSSETEYPWGDDEEANRNKEGYIPPYVYSEVTEENYDQILAGKEDWKTLSETEQEAVNEIISTYYIKLHEEEFEGMGEDEIAAVVLTYDILLEAAEEVEATPEATTVSPATPEASEAPEAEEPSDEKNENTENEEEQTPADAGEETVPESVFKTPYDGDKNTGSETNNDKTAVLPTEAPNGEGKLESEKSENSVGLEEEQSVVSVDGETPGKTTQEGEEAKIHEVGTEEGKDPTKLAVEFINIYLSDPEYNYPMYVDAYVSVTKDNYAQIVGSEDAWNALSTEAQDRVNATLQETMSWYAMTGTLTYQSLLVLAYECMAFEGEIEDSVAEAKRVELLGEISVPEPQEDEAIEGFEQVPVDEGLEYDEDLYHTIEAYEVEIDGEDVVMTLGFTDQGIALLSFGDDTTPSVSTSSSSNGTVKTITIDQSWGFSCPNTFLSYYDGGGNYRSGYLSAVRAHWLGGSTPVYCLEPLQSVPSHATANSADSVWRYNMTSSQKKAICMALAYGYPNFHTAAPVYDICATQLLIWEIVIGSISTSYPYTEYHNWDFVSRWDSNQYWAGYGQSRYYSLLRYYRLHGMLPTYVYDSVEEARESAFDLTGRSGDDYTLTLTNTDDTTAGYWINYYTEDSSADWLGKYTYAAYYDPECTQAVPEGEFTYDRAENGTSVTFTLSKDLARSGDHIFVKVKTPSLTVNDMTVRVWTPNAGTPCQSFVENYTSGSKTTYAYAYLVINGDPHLTLEVDKTADKALVSAAASSSGVTWKYKSNQPLANVTFDLYHIVDKNNDGKPDMNSDGSYALGTHVSSQTTGTYASGAETWGKALFTELDPEVLDYILVETKTPYLYRNTENLNKDSGKVQFHVRMNEATDPNTFTVKNSMSPIKVFVYKYDSDTNERIDIDGAVFGLYAAADIFDIYGNKVVAKDTLLKKITEGETGVSLEKSSSGNYYVYQESSFYGDTFYVKEITPPEGYKLNTEVLGTYSHNAYTTSFAQTDDVRTYSVNCYNQPLVDLTVAKYAEDTIEGATVTGTGVDWVYTKEQPLADVTFSLYKAVDTNNDGEPDKEADGDYVLGSHINTKTTGSYSSGHWGKVIFGQLEQGDYILIETNAPALYSVVDSSYLNAETGVVQAVVECYGDSTGDNSIDYTVTDAANKVVVYIDKYDAGTGDLIKTEDAEFAMYASSDIKNSAGKVIVKAGQLIATSTPVGNGRYAFWSEQGEAAIIPAGNYYIEEVNAPEGYAVGMSAQDISLYTGKTASFSSAAKTTKVIVDFYDSEVSAVNLEVTKESSESITGSTIDADGVTWRYTAGLPLGDVTLELYNIVDADDDGYADSDANGDYKLGSFVASQITNNSPASNKWGTALFGGLEKAQYILVEAAAPNQYNQSPLANNKTGNVRVLIDLRDEVGGATANYTMSNGLGDMELNIYKADSYNGESVNIDDAVFGLYAAEDITDPYGTVLVPKDTLIDLIAKGEKGVKVLTDEDGYTYFNAAYINFPNISVYVKEIQAPQGYLVAATQYIYDSTATEGTSWTTGGSSVTKDFVFYDEPELVDLVVEKLADRTPTGATAGLDGIEWAYTKNLPLGNVTFELYHAVDADADGAADKDASGDYILGDVIDRKSTGTQYTPETWGKVEFNDLRSGQYILCEVDAPGTYMRSEFANDTTGNVRVLIDLTNEVGTYTFTMKDYMVGIDIEIIKTNSSDGSVIDIDGAEFNLFANEDVLDPYGEIILPRDTLIMRASEKTEGVTVKTSENGKRYYSIDLPGYPVIDMYAREVVAPDGFSVSNETIYSLYYNETATSFSTTEESTTYAVLTMKDDPLVDLLVTKLADKAIESATEKETGNGVTWIYEKTQPMGGVTFELYKATDYDKDGEPDVKEDGDYELGEYIGEGVTGEYEDSVDTWGQIRFEGLVQGYYVLIEKEAPISYGEVASAHYNKITGTAQALIHVTSVNGDTVYEYEWIDYLNDGYIIITKYDKRTREIVDTVGGLYGLYSAEDIYNEKGELVVPKDTLIATSVSTAAVIEPNNTWYKGSVAKSGITAVKFVDTYALTGNETEYWDASEAQDGTIMAYRTGTEVVIVSGGRGQIYANPDSSYMFDGFTSLKSISGISLLNTKSATTMNHMFSNTGLTSLDVTGFDTRNVKDFGYMFYNSPLSSLDTSHFDTANAESMTYMFANTKITSAKTSGFNTAKVNNFASMFANTPITTLDISNFNTASATNMNYMLSGMSKLKSLNAEGLDTNGATMTGFFSGNTALGTVTVGDSFNFKVALPTPNASTLTVPSGYHVDGKWYSATDNTPYSPSSIPDNTAETYYAYTYLLSSITVTKAPTTTVYDQGDAFSKSGMVIKATYTDGHSRTVTGYTVTNGSSLSYSQTSVTISYTENGVTKTTTQPITVNRVLKSIKVSTAPTKTTYNNGETFSSSGMKITATYTDGGSKVVSGWVVKDASAALTYGQTSVTISYTENGITKTTTQAITVNRVLSKIAITTAPSDTSYYHGESFSKTGMVVKAYYTHAPSTGVTITGYTVTNGSSLTYGQTSVTISYTENGVTKTATQAITVGRKLTSIAVTKAPTTTTYDHGDTFNKNGMVVTATYSDGNKSAVTGYTYSPTTLSYGTSNLTISYTEGGITKTTTQAITVNRVLSSIKVTTAPTKTAYVPGEDFSTSGMVVKAYYTHASTTGVTISNYTVTNGSDMPRGQTSVTISYTENGVTKTTTQAITVNRVLTSIKVTTNPSQTVYWHSDAFSKTGMVVTAYFADGYSKAVSGYTLSSNATSPLTVDDATNDYETETITLSYTENSVTKTTTLDVIVCNYKQGSDWITLATDTEAEPMTKLYYKYTNNLAGGYSEIGFWTGVLSNISASSADYWYNWIKFGVSEDSFLERGVWVEFYPSSSYWQDFDGAYYDYTVEQGSKSDEHFAATKIPSTKSSWTLYLWARTFVYAPSEQYNTIDWKTATIPALYPSGISAADYYASLTATSSAALSVGLGTGISANDLIDATLWLLSEDNQNNTEASVATNRSAYFRRLSAVRRNTGATARGVNALDEDAAGIYTINFGQGEGEPIPAGKYYVRELKAPSGYHTDAEDQEVIFFEGTTTEFTDDAIPESYDLSFYNTLIDSIKIKVTKTADLAITDANITADGLTWEYTSNVPVNGVVFDLYESVDANSDGNPDKDADGDYVLGNWVGTSTTGGPESDNWGVAYFGGLTQKKYVLVEISAPEIYGGATSSYVNRVTGVAQTIVDCTDVYGVAEIPVSWTDYLSKGTITVTKKDTFTGAILTDEAAFELYTAESIVSPTTGETIVEPDTLVAKSTNNGDGTYSFSCSGYLAGGKYYIKEVNAPDGYNLSTDRLYVEFLDGTISTFAAGTAQYNKELVFTNEPSPIVRVKKIASETGNVLPGAVFGLFAGEDVYDSEGNLIMEMGELLEEVTTGADGTATFKTELPIGPNGATFFVKEQDAPDGYQLSEHTYYIFTHYATEEDYLAVFGAKQAVFEFTFSNLPNEAGSLHIHKYGEVLSAVNKNAETNVWEFAYEFAGLEDTVFNIYANKVIADSEGHVLYEAGELVYGGLTTDSKGGIDIASLPFGEYRVEEVAAPYGYMMAVDSNYPKATPWLGEFATSQTITIDGTVTDGHFILNFWDPRQLPVVQAIKVESGTDIPLAGATFGLYAAEDIAVNGIVVPADSLVGLATSQADGTASFLCDIPIDNSYYVKELEAPSGYELSTEVYSFDYNYTGIDGEELLYFTHTFENTLEDGAFVIHKNGLGLSEARINRETGVGEFIYKNAGLAGAVFDLYRADGAGELVASNLTTGEDNQILLRDLEPGYYRLVETQAPEGYLIAEKEVLFVYNPDSESLDAPAYGDVQDYIVAESSLTVQNDRKKVMLDITKVAEETNRPLMGAKFGLYAGEDMLYGSNPIYADDLIETAISDEYGEVSFTADLPVGFTFYIQEIEAPEYFQKSDEVFTFTTEDDGASSDTITYSKVFVNKMDDLGEYEVGEIDITKMDTDGNELEGAVFLLEYSLDEGTTWEPVYTDKDTTGDIPGATWTEVVNGMASTDESGALEFTYLYAPLPEQGNILYRLTEVEAPLGYRVDEPLIYEGTIPVVDSETENGYDFTLDFTVENEWALGSITVQKVNSLGVTLPDASYLLEFSLDDGQSWVPVTYRDPETKVIAAGTSTAQNLVDGVLTTTAEQNPVVFSDILCDGKTRYRLTEIKSPNGHTLLAESIFDGYLPVVEEGSGEKIFDLSYVVINDKSFMIPSTGASGFVLPVIASVIGITGVVGCMALKRRRKEDKPEESEG